MYHQIPLTAESRHLTNFITPWSVMSEYGLMIAPDVFQRFMDQNFKDY